MPRRAFDKAKSLSGSVLFHALVFAVLVLTIDFRSTPPPPPPQPVVQATAVDAAQVEAELERIRQQEQAARDAEAARQRELERQAAEQRQAEEARIAEEQRKAEEKRIADEQRKAEEQRVAEAKRKADEQRQKELQEALAAEERARAEAEQQRRDDTEIQRYLREIAAKVDAAFQLSGQAAGLSCTLRLRLIPGGDVAETVIVRSSGNAVFDRQAQLAVLKAVPLPVPGDPRLFRKMQEIQFEFDPN